ncbi:MAG TPA: restriction endonuclease subunit S [Rhodanobacteraceae bacterium]|nr:restriction endonuclease subunit S [Rhodanobacteraceae bacterium]
MKDDFAALSKVADAAPAYQRGIAKDDAARAKQKNTLVKNRAAVETWSVPLQDIYDNPNLRLDATHYDRETANALQQLRKSGYPLKRLADLADVLLPGQFARIWAKDAKHGIRYINATDLMSLNSIGVADERFLSHETKTDINELVIHEGWLLLTCSGTIGRLFYVTERIDKWVATHDLIRIVPHAGVSVGFLHAYLSSPVAQKQILGHTHGGQIDHVTHHQVGGVLVPELPPEQVKEIHKHMMDALRQRERAIAQISEIADDIEQKLKRR